MNARTLSVCALLVPAVLVAADSPKSASAPPRPVPYAIEPIDKHPEWDAEYSRLIREATTDPQFGTDLVDHLPASATVPTPKKFLGYIAGAPDHLTYAEDVNAYMRALQAASPRVKVFAIGNTEEGREMIAVAVADEATIASLNTYREITAKLADPRSTSDEQARSLIAQGKPIYYLTGAMHSPETGSPEMLMELAYRLAVDDSPMIAAIRANVITLITPVLEVDGRDRMVDIVRWGQANPSAGLPPLVYWGHYVAHDDNRDAIGLGLALTRNVLRTSLAWHPQVIHDLHESIPFLYISTGTGPYNAWLDPLVIDEFTRMADLEVQELTRKGLPGVWTHGFYDGWAPNYLFWVGLGHNAIGRFYETFGNHVPSTEQRVVRGWSDRAWFRPNPPLPTVRWSLRNNVNYQESGVLLALSDVASRRSHFLEQYWTLCKRSVAKARTEGPAAYVFDAGQKRQGQLRDLMMLLRTHGIEVEIADKAFSVKQEWPPRVGAEGRPSNEEKGKEKATPKDEILGFASGSFVVRMDQPLSRLADALLDTQYVRGDERVYDDTG
ncbi:MAG TPA: M14 family zinc carboxypeptidase, partial [Thermoanaerobaculaceae bacterium]|nr:M14 family zinc carboxypeptidase [Thermoanaerobaculaceae bacterium]